MEVRLRAGVAICNAGEYHAAHDAWEPEWIDLDAGTDDERFLHGLIQFTAAVYHGSRENWAGLRGLAESATEYFDGLPATYRGVNVGEIRSYLGALADDPERIERDTPPPLTIDGTAIELVDLDPEATFVAAEVLAEEHGHGEETVERAVEYARADLAAGDRSRFVTLLFDFVREVDRRAIVARRLGEHVDRRTTEQRDVEGLFE
jgi:hypothetical protein